MQSVCCYVVSSAFEHTAYCENYEKQTERKTNSLTYNSRGFKFYELLGMKSD